ncbi:hypothetical protein HanRHA438_Chr10g0460011 [Helianthus annuus]|uniref:Uncharacterized protein n=1 Tax=Helianthus annuus TaxID=4232 RepID=A0A251UVF0_HELAN|nr:hypothetical protein HanXRQr2_Chr10g0447451 [Helianthus annuus]KAJ0880157.1 hypothetical protein HanRHA438_Chr10g0460011 [Helianthus annuus]
MASSQINSADTHNLLSSFCADSGDRSWNPVSLPAVAHSPNVHTHPTQTLTPMPFSLSSIQPLEKLRSSSRLMLFLQTPTSQPIPYLFLRQTPTIVERNIHYLTDRWEGVRCRRREEPNPFDGHSWRR